MPAPITFVVSGRKPDGASRGRARVSPAPTGTVKQSVELTARRAAGGGDVRMDAIPGEDAVVFHIAGGPSLWLHPEHASQMLQAQHDPARERGAKDDLRPGEIRVPARLQWRLEDAVPTRGATRGFLGDVLVEAIDIITGFAVDKAADFVASKVVDRFDARVVEQVYKLNPNELARLYDQEPSPVRAADAPSLVLVHGTFSETSGTFGKLWTDHPQRVRSLFKAYGDRVYGLDHRTLGASPIANAITLAKAAEAGARLHLLTHSRGGLVAEVLARVAGAPDDTFVPFRGQAYAGQRTELRTLAKIVASKRITVERIVRVACPARGTLLASKRLDAYVSVVKWALELAGLPVVPELVDFLGEVARRRAEPDTLPGLAAQMPDNPLVQWLHATDNRLSGDLRVVAGDLKGDSVMSWVKTLLSDAFFWTDNDLVVQTRSMYGGTPRADGASFVLDRGGKVSHFNYFSNPDTARAIVDGLVQDEPDGFRVIGPLSWAGTDASGVRAARVQRSAAAAADLPAVFVLPGILGSNLKVGDDRVWLGWRVVNGFEKLTYQDGERDSVAADGPIGIFYDDLAAFLSSDHDVTPFAFDWRRPIEESAHLLADAVDAALDARKGSGKPVRLLAHSMGGLVARTMQLERPKTWERMMKVTGARLLMLGTPNDGSFAPMQMLSGDDTFGNLLTVVGAPFRGHETRQLIAQFPGFLQLQAGVLGDLGKEAIWKALAEADLEAARKNSGWHVLPIQMNEARWGIPGQRVLDAAARLRARLDKQRDNDLGRFADKLLLVVGKAAFTPAAFQMAKDGLVYLAAPEAGDGRVTLQSALLPGVETWALDCEHGSLPRRKAAFEAYRDLLNDGTTTRLSPVAALTAVRGGAAARPALVPSRPARSLFAGVPPQLESEVLAPSGVPSAAVSRETAESSLQITVINGDLMYVEETLLIGHYRSSKLTGAEAVMDRAIAGSMSASLLRGLYPEAAGSHQIFSNQSQAPDNPWQVPRPKAVVVAGLGAEGELRGSDLIATVRQAVIAWAQRLAEQAQAPAQFSLATTLLGSGGTGVSAGQAAQLIAQGVREANVQISRERTERQRWPRVGQLRIVELYLDRAAEAWRAIKALAVASPALYSLGPSIETGIGPMRRPPDAGYRGADYDFISALIQRTEEHEEQVVYSIDTKRARAEVRAQSAQVPLISNLVLRASNSANDDPQIGRTLFSLLVPVDLEAFMGSSGATVLELDRGTAGIPWELLDNHIPGSGDDRPWAIRTKLLRKLRTGGSARPVNDATAEDTVLVVGDPACDRTVYPPLFGARREAAAVAACLGKQPSADERPGRAAATDTTGGARVPRVTTLISSPDGGSDEPDMSAVIKKAMAGPWRIIHIAGHGEPPVTTDGRFEPRGVVLSDKSFLGPREIGSLRVIPELVFVNCCYLATGDVQALLKAPNYDRAKFASGVAEALIKVGVRCVVAAGWAVDDGAAEVFAGTFYARLLAGASFIDAVAAARVDARARGGNTWAAYQCYGDPDWRYRWSTGDAQRPAVPSPSQEFAEIASTPGLLLALEAMAVRSEFQGANSDDQVDRLKYLEGATTHLWRDSGELAEAFGQAWAKAGRSDEAIVSYERARTALDGKAPLAAIEQLANLKVRRAWTAVSKAPGDRAVRDLARAEITAAMRLLDTLLVVGSTIERESIYGSAYKRLALIEAAEKRDGPERAAIAEMKKHYAAAEAIARARIEKDPTWTTNVWYPAMNRLAAEIALDGGTRQTGALPAQTIELVLKSMRSSPPDFWSVVGQTELEMYAALLSGSLELELPSIIGRFAEHYARVSAPKMWASVYDNATFVLSKYQARAAAGEARAAGRLLEALAGHGRIGALAATAGSTPAAIQPRSPRARKAARRTTQRVRAVRPAGARRVTPVRSVPKGRAKK